MPDGSSNDSHVPVLEFRDVVITAPLHQFGEMEGVSLTVGVGEIALVRLEEGRENIPLAHVAQGLVGPNTGTVLFEGEDWAAMSARRQAEQRGRTRRVFERYGWITNLDVVDNVCLSECHNTRRPMQEILAEAIRLAAQFGLDGIPEGRPTRTPGLILRKLEWVRAFMGTPALIILERPLTGAPKADAPRLFDAVCAAADHGAGVLWMTDDDRAWACPGLAKAKRFRMEGTKLKAV